MSLLPIQRLSMCSARSPAIGREPPLAAASNTDRVVVSTNRLWQSSLAARFNNTNRGLRIPTGAIERYTSYRLECGYRVLELVDRIKIFLAPTGRISNCLRK